MLKSKRGLWFSVYETENHKDTIFIKVVSEERAIIEKLKKLLPIIKRLNTEDLKFKFSENSENIVKALFLAINGHTVNANDISDIGFNNIEGHHVTFTLQIKP